MARLDNERAHSLQSFDGDESGYWLRVDAELVFGCTVESVVSGS